MEYKEIVAVTGISGLYQLLATKADGAIVRNLEDKTTKFISARLHNVTPLESIEIYTTNENVRLHNVLQKIKDTENTIPIVDAKKADNNTIKEYFKSIFPDFDEERVYVSDMKKMLKWYDLLKKNDLLNFEKQNEEAQAAEAGNAEVIENDNVDSMSAAETEGLVEDKPTKKPRAKKSADTEAAAENEEKPKKIARKKKAEGDDADAGDEEKPGKKAAAKKTKED